MSALTISFFASAVITSIAALVAVGAPQPRHSLAGFAVALTALVIPLIQLRAPAVAALLLLDGAVALALLGALVGLVPAATVPRRTSSPAFWILAGAGLLGFVWVLLATGSRQVVESGPPLVRGATFGTGLFLELAANHVVSILIVGLLALCSVIAAVLTLVGERLPPSQGLASEKSAPAQERPASERPAPTKRPAPTSPASPKP
jgi:hypothetical protein